MNQGIDIGPFKGSELERTLFLENVMLGKDYFYYEGDVTESSRTKIQLESHPNIFGLVNNAGLLGNDYVQGGRNEDSWGKVMSANATSAFLLTELCYPKMQKEGSIVNIGSIEIDMAAPDVVLYAASKGALWGMTVAYSTSLAPKIRVNMVSPGNVNTERNRAQYEKEKLIIDRFERRTPLKRSVKSQEVADLVLFLLSEKSGAITGQNYRIDCGYTRSLWDSGWSA